MRNPGHLFLIGFLVFTGLLLLVTAHGVLQQGEPEWGGILTCVAAALLYLAYRVTAEGTRRKKFLSWLLRHRDQLGNQLLEYEGLQIMPETSLIQYRLVISLGVISFTVPSRFFVEDEQVTLHQALFFSGVTLLLGWWAFPLGPVHAVRALISNTGKRGRIQVTDLISEASGGAET